MLTTGTAVDEPYSEVVGAYQKTEYAEASADDHQATFTAQIRPIRLIGDFFRQILRGSQEN